MKHTLRSPRSTNSICTRCKYMATFPLTSPQAMGQHFSWTTPIKLLELYEQAWMSSTRISAFQSLHHAAGRTAGLLLGTLKPDFPPCEFSTLHNEKNSEPSFNLDKIWSYGCGAFFWPIIILFISHYHVNTVWLIQQCLRCIYPSKEKKLIGKYPRDFLYFSSTQSK